MATETAFPLQDRGRTRGELEALYREWGILDLIGETTGAMPAAWLQVLNIARNLLARRPLDGVGIADDLLELVGAPAPEYTTVRRTHRRKRLVYSARDDTAVEPLKSLGDLPLMTMPDLLLRTISQEIFDYQLMSGGINGVYGVDLPAALQEYDEVVEELVPAPRPLNRRRQKVYILLDVSNSMREENKILFAKAVVLAYAVTASREEARIYLRTYGNTVHERTDCLDQEHFPALARRVLTVTPDGSTDIKRALDMAIGDIRALDDLNRYDGMFKTPETEILLLSDCESYSLPYIPAGIKLHTVHLKSGHVFKSYVEGLERIREASATFHAIDTGALQLPDASRDRWLLLQDGRPLDGGQDGMTMPEGRSGPTTVRAERLLEVYERMEATAQKGGRARFALRRMRGAVRLDAGAALRALLSALKGALFRRHVSPAEAWVAAPAVRTRVSFREKRR